MELSWVVIECGYFSSILFLLFYDDDILKIEHITDLFTVNDWE